MDSPTVYVVNQAGIDFTPAKQYGDVIFITQGYSRYDDIPKLTHQINTALCNSKPTDFLILSGNNLACAIVYHLWLARHGRVNVLHWMNNEYTIVPMHQISLAALI